MKEVYSVIDLMPNDCTIKWRMTDLCNIHCSYCGRRRHTISKWTKEEKESQEDKLCEIIKDISKMINKTKFSNVKLNLLGGEITIFDLVKIFKNLESDKIKVVRITTNTMQSIKYYFDLLGYLHSRNIQANICFSLHTEFLSFDKYFEKIAQLKDKVDILTCEIPSRADNQDICQKFIDKCEELEVNYCLDADIRASQKGAREKGLLTANKIFGEKNPRYLVTFTDGTQKYYIGRSQFLTDKDIDGKDLKYIHSKGLYCTIGYNYVYIDFDKVNCRKSVESGCHELMDIKDFNFLDRPAVCKSDYCTICGCMSLYREWK